MADQPDLIVLNRHRDLEGREMHPWVRPGVLSIILAIAAFGAPSGPWQDLHDLSYTICPALASAAKTVTADVPINASVVISIRIYSDLLAFFEFIFIIPVKYLVIGIASQFLFTVNKSLPYRYTYRSEFYCFVKVFQDSI